MERKRIIEDRLQRLIERIKKADYKDSDNEHMARLAKERINELQQNGIFGIDRFVQKLLDRVNDKDEYLDILMEGRFAIVLARNNFSDIHIEYIDKGPDLKASWNNNTIYFEVTRRHSEVDGWAEPAEAAFVLSDTVKKTIRRIKKKLSQLQSGEINIVVIWSDTPKLLSQDVAEAFEHIKQDDPEKYKDLSGVLYTEGGGVDSATLKEYYLFENKEAFKPLGLRLIRKLKSLHERDINQVQREFKELGDALRRLKAQDSLWIS